MKKLPFKTGGFTLIELLVAITIFSAVIGSVYTAYRITFDNIKTTETKLQNTQTAQNIFSCITDDLEHISIDQDSPFRAEKSYNKMSGGVDLTFNTTNAIITHPDELQTSTFTVIYTMEKDDKTDQIKLFRSSINSQLDSEKNKAIKWLVADNIKDIKLFFYDKDGNDSDEWIISGEELVEQENEQQKTPSLVRLEVYLQNPDDTTQSKMIATNIALPEEVKK